MAKLITMGLKIKRENRKIRPTRMFWLSRNYADHYCFLLEY